MSEQKKSKDSIDVLAVMKAKIPRLSPSELAKISLKDWAERWLVEYSPNLKKSTRISYRSAIDNHIVRVFQDEKLIDITDDDVQMFILSLIQGVGLDHPLTAKTIKNVHGVLHKCLETAVELKVIPYNPAEHTKLPKSKKPLVVPLNEAQTHEFLTAIQGHVYEPIYKLALFTGMRQAEILGLTKDCFNFDEGYIRLYQQLIWDKKKKSFYMDSLKNNRQRVIYPPKSIMDMMKEYMITHPNKSKFVFSGKKYKHLTHNGVRNAFRRIVAKLGYPKCRFHDLRHTYAVLSLTAGIDVKTISDFMGHHSVSFTLDTYVYVLAEMKKESAKRLQNYMDEKHYTI